MKAVLSSTSRGMSAKMAQLEPGALGYPAITFNHGDVSFYRLRMPYVEQETEEADDWRLDIDQLSTWIVGNHGAFKVSCTKQPIYS